LAQVEQVKQQLLGLLAIMETTLNLDRLLSLKGAGVAVALAGLMLMEKMGDLAGVRYQVEPLLD
jgi:hypothetical protein